MSRSGHDGIWRGIFRGGSKATAVEIKTDTPITGALADKDAKAWYKFTTTKQGYFYVSLETESGEKVATYKGWDLYLYEDDGTTEMWKMRDVEKTGYTIAYPLSVGSSCYIKIESATSDVGWAPSGQKYVLKVNETEDKDWEIEKNDLPAKANAISTNHAYKGNLSTSKDTDWYQFEIAKQGYFTVSLKTESGEKVTSYKGWDLYVYEGDNSTLIRSIENVTLSNTTIKLPYDKGKYYIKVTSAAPGDNSWSPTGQTYLLTVTETEDKDWEIENNSVNTAANKIATNQTYKGNLDYSRDADWYQFEITKQGYFEVVLGPDKETSTEALGNGWKLEIYQEGQDKTIKERYYPSITAAETTAKFPYDKGKYMIKVSASDTSYAPIGQTYNLTVKETEDSAWEIEENDTSAKATTISTGKAYSGLLYGGSDDMDFFKFSIPKGKGQKVSVTMDTKHVVDIEKLGAGWKWTLYSAEGGNVLASKGNIKTTQSSDGIALKGGDYYFKIENADDSYYKNNSVSARNPYCFTINTTDLDCAWVTENGKSYWYEHGDIQGTYDDPQGVLGDGTVRGREICDNTVLDEKGNGTWFWLDAVYDGAKACSKEVWMPYIYQDEKNWDDGMIDTVSRESGDMAEQVKKAIKAAKDGVTDSAVIGKWVRYDKDGKMVKGWYTVQGDDAKIYPDQAGNTYYYDFQTGLMAKGTVRIDGKTYTFDEVTGVLQK